MYLLDTNILSELRKPEKADKNVLSWSKDIDSSQQYLSAISIQEIEIGILQLLQRRDLAQADHLRTWLDGSILPRFEGRILVVDTAVALKSARLHVPDPRPFSDALIAATALIHDLIVVTRNVSDFLPTGVRILNPFDANPKVISA